MFPKLCWLRSLLYQRVHLPAMETSSRCKRCHHPLLSVMTPQPEVLPLTCLPFWRVLLLKALPP
jgi:hypothetical protein